MSMMQWIAGAFCPDPGAPTAMPTTHWRVAGFDFYVESTALAFAQATADRTNRIVPVMVCVPGQQPHVLIERYPREASPMFAMDPL